VLTVAALAWFATLPLAAYLRDGQTWRFLIHNAMLWRIEYDLPGVFADNAYGGAVNGSLWTLPVELRAYLYLTVLGVPGLLRLRHGSSLVLAVWASLVTLTLATFSWFLVEQRALRRKGSMARVLARYRR